MVSSEQGKIDICYGSPTEEIHQEIIQVTVVKSEDKKEARGFAYRLALALAIGVLVVGYTAGIVTGRISQQHRIDVVGLATIALAAIAVALLLRPEIFERLKVLEMSGFKLEMLDKVREKQVKQESELEDIKLILPLLLPDRERKHMLNLAEGKTDKYKGNHELRTELRRLRSIGLIKMRTDREVNQMKDSLAFDLAHYVKLTPLGSRWVKRINQIEDTEVSDQHDQNSNI